MSHVLSELPPDVLRALYAEPRALSGFALMPASYRRAWTGHVTDAVRPVVREARIERLVDAMVVASDAVARPA